MTWPGTQQVKEASKTRREHLVVGVIDSTPSWHLAKLATVRGGCDCDYDAPAP